MYICVPHPCLVPQRPEKGVGLPGTGGSHQGAYLW